MKCQHQGCPNEAEVVDYRPCFKDDEGDWDCYTKVVCCRECVGLDHDFWNAPIVKDEDDTTEAKNANPN